MEWGKIYELEKYDVVKSLGVKQLWYFLFSNWWSDVHNFCNFFWFKLILFFITLVKKVDLSTQNSRPQGIWGYRRGCHVWQIRAKNLRLGHKQTANTKSQIKTTQWRVEEEGGHFSSFAPRSLTNPTICNHNKGRIMYKVGTFSLSQYHLQRRTDVWPGGADDIEL